MPAIIVTGAAGFLGSHLCEKYLRQGYNVVGIDNFSTGLESNVQEISQIAETLKNPDRSGVSWKGRLNYIFIKHDVTNEWDFVDKIPQGWIDDLKYIFHFASPASPPLYQKLSIETIWVNTLGLERALKFAQACQARTVFASTSEIYGDPKVNPQPESYWGNVNSYGERSCYDEAKRLGESLIFSYNKRWNSRHGLVRIFNTYGPRMNPSDGRVIVNFLVQGIRGDNLTVYGDGKQTRSFCYVDDLIEGITRYADSGLSTPVNLGSQFEFTILELAQIIQKEIFPEKNLKIQHLELPKDDPTQRQPDTQLAKKQLNDWEPKVELRQGLKRMLEWLES